MPHQLMTRRRLTGAGLGAGISTLLATTRFGAAPPALARQAVATPAPTHGFAVPGYPPLSPDPAPLTVVTIDGDRVVVRDAFGEVDLPRNPRRVVALDETALKLCLALDLDVVAAGHFGSQLPASLAPFAPAAVSLPQRDLGYDLELVLGLDADLIVSTNPGLEPEVFEQVRAIAPTVVLDWTFHFWRNRLQELGAALGREAAATAANAAFDQAIATTRQAIDQYLDPAATFDTILFFPDSLWLYAAVVTSDGATYLQAANRWLFGDLQRLPAPSLRELIPPDEDFVELSLEMVPQLQGDYLVIFPGGYGTIAEPGFAETITDPLWQMTPSVAAGRVLPLYADRAIGLYTTRYMFDQFVSVLAAGIGTPVASASAARQ